MSKYLDKSDREEMAKFQRLIDDQATIASALKQRLQHWFMSKFEKYKLDPQKMWSLDPHTGQIKEKEEKQ